MSKLKYSLPVVGMVLLPFRSRAVKDIRGGDMFRVYHSDGTFIGVFRYDEGKHMYYPEKIFLGGN